MWKFKSKKTKKIEELNIALESEKKACNELMASMKTCIVCTKLSGRNTRRSSKRPTSALTTWSISFARWKQSAISTRIS